MNLIPEPIRFNWDQGNINKNLEKHKITNEESEEVFLNPPVTIIEDPKHSLHEPRLMALGKADSGKLLTVIFTARNKKIRIISARQMNKKERKLYEKN
ncbi:BrnT family toxin [Patescibacteria group bacterium]|nr:BrnT family toxin [Patescibacteria group bacterium]